MLIKQLDDCKEIVAGDSTYLRELFHPDRDDTPAIRYSLAWAMVKPGERSYPHRMLTSEVYYILQGQGQMVIENEKQAVRPGDAIYIPPGAQQHIVNIGDVNLEFLCIVDPAWRKEDEIVEEDGSHNERPR